MSRLKHFDRYRLIGRRVAYFREKKGLSQQMLADEVGISKSYLSKIEAPGSIKACSLDVLFDIADILGVEVHHLFGEERRHDEWKE